MDAVLERCYAPEKTYLSDEEKDDLKRMILESIPTKEGDGVEEYWNTHIIQHVLEENGACP
ncbi:hypothetical protein NYE66_15680 [Geobacillus sp. FSL W8-0466]|uniref:hypothetical protein n=1 Tax=Geobacillus sp. FSL W8-0466 TaxID=2975350 RepID=UPI0030DD63FD